MAVAARCKVAGVARSASARANVVCQAHKGIPAPLLAATVAASALLLQPPAEAGVVLTQPELKSVFYNDAPAEKPKARPFKAETASAPPTQAEKAAPKPEVEEESHDGVDPRSVALPAALVGIAALAVGASKIDGGFNDWVTESGVLVKTSGIGFEEEIKEKFAEGKPQAKKGLFGLPKKQGTTSVKANGGKKGTQGVKANGTKSTKKGLF